MLVAVCCVYGHPSESRVGMSNDQPQFPCNCDEANIPVDRRKGRTPVCYHLFGQDWSADTLVHVMRHVLRILYGRYPEVLRRSAGAVDWLGTGPPPVSQPGHICDIADGLWADVSRVDSTNLRSLVRKLLRAVGLSGFREFQVHKFGRPCPRCDTWQFPRWAPKDLRDPYP